MTNSVDTGLVRNDKYAFLFAVQDKNDCVYTTDTNLSTEIQVHWL